MESEALQRGYDLNADCMACCLIFMIHGFCLQFRPKNFSKPEAPSEDILTMVKKEPMDVDPQPSGPRRNRTGGPMAHKKKDIGQDQVVFGGGVGGTWMFVVYI